MKASEYKKHLQTKKSGSAIDVTLPSGAVWKLRKPVIEQFIAAGRLPASLTAKMLSMAKKAGNGQSAETKAELMKLLTPDEILQNLAFGCELLQHSAVEPRIVLEPPAPSDAILPTDIDPDDFRFLIEWVFSGGETGSGLSSFR